MADFAELNLKVDSRDIRKGKVDLQGFTAQASKVDQSVDRMSKRVRRDLRTVQRETRATTHAFSSAARTINNFRTVMAAAVSLLAVRAIWRGFRENIIGVSETMEGLELQLRAVIGSIEGAQDALRDIREFAVPLPISTEEVVKGFVLLRSVGVPAAREVIETLTKVSIATQKNLSDVAAGFVSLETEVLRRLGVEIDRTGKRAIIMSEGIRLEVAKTNAAIRDGLIEVFEFRYKNALELVADSWVTAQSVLRSEWIETADVLAKGGVTEVLGTVFDNLSNFLKEFRESGALDELANQLGIKFAQAAVAVVKSVKVMITAFNALKGALNALLTDIPFIGLALQKIFEGYQVLYERFRVEVSRQSVEDFDKAIAETEGKLLEAEARLTGAEIGQIAGLKQAITDTEEAIKRTEIDLAKAKSDRELVFKSSIKQLEASAAEMESRLEKARTAARTAMEQAVQQTEARIRESERRLEAARKAQERFESLSPIQKRVEIELQRSGIKSQPIIPERVEQELTDLRETLAEIKKEGIEGFMISLGFTNDPKALEIGLQELRDKVSQAKEEGAEGVEIPLYITDPNEFEVTLEQLQSKLEMLQNMSPEEFKLTGFFDPSAEAIGKDVDSLRKKLEELKEARKKFQSEHIDPQFVDSLTELENQLNRMIQISQGYDRHTREMIAIENDQDALFGAGDDGEVTPPTPPEPPDESRIRKIEALNSKIIDLERDMISTLVAEEDKHFAKIEENYQKRLDQIEDIRSELAELGALTATTSAALESLGGVAESERITEHQRLDQERLESRQELAEQINSIEHELTGVFLDELGRQRLAIERAHEQRLRDIDELEKEYRKLGEIPDEIRMKLDQLRGTSALAAEHQTEELNKAATDVEGVWTGVFNTIGSGLVNAFTSGASAAESFANVVASILLQLGQAILQAQLLKVAMAAIGGQNASTGQQANTFVGGILNFLLSSKGSVLQHGNLLKQYRLGGVVSNPTIFPMKSGAGMMSETEPEAIMPLKRSSSGRLGVEAMSRGGGIDYEKLAEALSRRPIVLTTVNDFSGAIAPTSLKTGRKEIETIIIDDGRRGGVISQSLNRSLNTRLGK